MKKLAQLKDYFKANYEILIPTVLMVVTVVTVVTMAVIADINHTKEMVDFINQF